MSRFRKAKKPKYDDSCENIEKQSIPSCISECEKRIKDIFQNSSDIVIQTFATHKATTMIVYIDGLVNKDLVDRDIIKPIKSAEFDGNIALAIKTVFEETEDMSIVVEDVLTGKVAVFYEKSCKAYLVELMGWQKRAVSQPEAEAVIRGPKEGFTESIRTNTALIRRKIKTPKFIVENMTLGRQTKTVISLVYIDGIVNREVLSDGGGGFKSSTSKRIRE